MPGLDHEDSPEDFPMSDSSVDNGKRTWIIASRCAGAVVGGFTVCPSSAVPASERAAPRPPSKVDLAALPGEKITVEWRGKPVWIIARRKYRSPCCPSSTASWPIRKSPRKPDELTPSTPATNGASIKPGVLVVVGICTHRLLAVRRSSPARSPRCRTTGRAASCPATAPPFDLAGRVFKNKPAPDNLEVPPHVPVRHPTADR